MSSQPKTDEQLLKLLLQVAVRAAALGREIVDVNMAINGPPGATRQINVVGAMAVCITNVKRT